MAAPPFALDQTNPLDIALVSTYPANERTFRENVEDWMNFEHGSSSGRHKLPGGNDAARDAITDWEENSLWVSSQGTLETLQVNVGTKAAPSWKNVTGIAAVGDIPIGVAGGMATGLTVGAATAVLKSDGTNPAWLDLSSRGSLIISNATDVTTLAIGAANTFLSSDGTDPSWASQLASSNLPAGSTVQVVHVQEGGAATGTTVMPDDDSIPQNTEGDEYISLAITPTSASNTLLIDVNLMFSCSTTQTIIVGLFQDIAPGAIAATGQQVTGNREASVTFKHKKIAATTSATTFKIRIGPGAGGTVTFNGVAGVRTLGGAASSSITITEIKA